MILVPVAVGASTSTVVERDIERENGGRMAKRGRKPRRRRQKPQYPIATIAQYGPDDKRVTKIAVGIIEAEDAEPIMERWYGSDVMTNPEIQAQIAGFIEAHGVQSVVRTDGVIGCPHEEGIDFPKGRECPYCPFWSPSRSMQCISLLYLWYHKNHAKARTIP